MAAMTALAVARRRIHLPRIDTRVVVGVVLVAVSVLGGLRLSGSATPGTAVFVAAADLEAGHVLTRTDLERVEVRGPAAFLDGLERAGRGAPVGRVLRTPIRHGAPIALDALGGALPAGRDVTIPVSPEHALGGAIRAGDRVDVFATFDKGTDVARTILVARSASVRGVTRSDGLFGQGEGGITALTLVVDPDAAIGVAFAARNGELDVARSRGDVASGTRERFDADSLR
jgi:Flp pilus assembly protein CpaB